MTIRNFFGGFVEVANGLASILSLGYLAPGWDFRYHCWLSRRDIERSKKQLEPVAWMVYTLDGTSVCVTDNPADFTDEHRALPLYTEPFPTDEALLRQALEALESGAWDTLRGRNAAAAILDRLGEGAMIERNRHPAGRVFNTLFGLCQVADGFIRVLSLGYLHSRLTLTVSRKATEKLISRRKKLLEQLAQSPERQERENSND